MFLAIAVVIIQQMTFLPYLFETVFFTRAASSESHSLMVGVAMLSALLSIPSFAWNFTMAYDEKTKKDIAGTIISVSTFIFGISFLIFDFVRRIHELGGRIF